MSSAARSPSRATPASWLAVNIGKVHADRAAFAPSHLALVDRPGPLLPKEDEGRQGDRHEHAHKCAVLRNIPDRAFDEAGLIDKKESAVFPHLVAGEGSSIVVQGLALRCPVLDDGGRKVDRRCPTLTSAGRCSPVRTARGGASAPNVGCRLARLVLAGCLT